MSTKSPISANSMMLVEPARDLGLRHPVQTRRQADVLAHRQVADEAAGDLDERRDAAVDRRPCPRPEQHARDQLEQRRLALAVAADDADRLARPHVEATRRAAPRTRPARERRYRVREQILEAAAAAPVAAEADAEIVDLDRDDRMPPSQLLQHGALEPAEDDKPSARNTKQHDGAHDDARTMSTGPGKKPTRYRVKMPASGLNAARSANGAGRSLTAVDDRGRVEQRTQDEPDRALEVPRTARTAARRAGRARPAARSAAGSPSGKHRMPQPTCAPREDREDDEHREARAGTRCPSRARSG